MSTADPTTAEPLPCTFRRYEQLVDEEWIPQRDGVPSRNAPIRRIA